jgi:hypothetical protein
MKINIYYRHAAINNINQYRPTWFSYESCFKNLLKTIDRYDNINLTLAIDGDVREDFIKNYQDKFTLFHTNYKSSLLSYRALLEHIKKQPMQSNELIYFLENDYLHTNTWVDKIIELYSTFSNLEYVSLYDHNDKYFLPMYDELVSKIITTSTHHWRTTPSTCGSFIITRDIFDKDYDVWSTAVGDHNTFMYLNEHRSRFVLTPIPGLSTHCMEELMSPTINWEEINNAY